MKKILLFAMVLVFGLGMFSQYSFAEDNKKVILNQVYGTGNNQDVPVSHSFIELYNPTDKDISLEGMSVQYAKKVGASWSVYPLQGTIKAYSFYLIRGQLENNNTDYANLLKWTIQDEMTDLDFPSFRIDNKFYKVAIVDGVEPLTLANPFGQTGVLDLLGAENTEKPETTEIDGFETKASRDQSSKQKSLRRVDLVDTDNNDADFIKADYRLEESAIRTFAPRNSKCGNTLNGLPDPDKVVDPNDTNTPAVSETPTNTVTSSPTATPAPIADPTSVTAYVPVIKVSIAKPAGKYKTISKAVIYKKSSDKKGKLGSYKKGVSISVASVKGMYAKVKYKGKTGYVKITCLSFSKGQSGKVIANTYAYKNKSTTKGTYKKLNKNTKISLKKRAGQYYSIVLKNN